MKIIDATNVNGLTTVLCCNNKYFVVSLSYNSPKLFIFCPSPDIYMQEKIISAHILLKCITNPTYFIELTKSCILYRNNIIGCYYFTIALHYSCFVPFPVLFHKITFILMCIVSI